MNIKDIKTELLEYLKNCDLLNSVNVILVDNLLDNITIYKKAVKDISSNGIIIQHKMDNGHIAKKPNPALQIKESSEKQILKLLKELKQTIASSNKSGNSTNSKLDDIIDALK